MEGMDVDDISAGFSNLNIHVTSENNQLIPQEVLVTDELPKPLGHERHFPFLSLPWLAKWRIYTHLSSRDCIALSRTCRHMYKFNTLAYTHLQFLPPNNLFSLARSVCQLGQVLACSPHYSEAVRTIRIVGYNAPNIPEGCDGEAVYKALDEGVVTLLEHGRHVYSLTLDFNPSRAIAYFPHTFTTLLRIRTIRDLRLTPFLPPSYRPESIPPQEIVPCEEPPAYERVCLSVCSGSWLPIIMRDPRRLRWFGFSMWDKRWQPGDTNWAMTLRRVAEAATELGTLVLNGGRPFDADMLGQMLQIGFERGVLKKLRSLSVNTVTLSLSSLRQLFSGFSRSPVTHLRIVVNHNGRWLPDFGPHYIAELANLVPHLEELSLDQVGMPRAAHLPGYLGAWGEAFRMFKKLRRIVFASMFVLDLCCPGATVQDEDDDEEEETSGDEDPGMDIDDSSDEGDEGYESEEEEGDHTPDVDDLLAHNLVQLAAWADMFLDDHLRMLAPFAEIWFLDGRFGGQTAAGFYQRVMEGEGGRAEHMIYYPIRKRDGWWWNEHHLIPLD
ncbi:hypothetical protein BJV78DRAFT_684903 [Lactifluus subvellereus]|nr:hypothetical protein BJV78DRAFT_684903 [Lactifluus subvellereus]